MDTAHGKEPAPSGTNHCVCVLCVCVRLCVCDCKSHSSPNDCPLYKAMNHLRALQGSGGGADGATGR